MEKLLLGIILVHSIFFVHCDRDGGVLHLADYMNFETLCNFNVPDISESCYDQLTESCQNKDVLGTMLDASSKFPYTGLAKATSRDYGNYDECMTIDHKYNGERILGKYCLFGLAVFDELNLTITNGHYFLSVCMPDKCTSQDYNKLIQNAANQTFNVSFPGAFNDNQCTTKEFGTEISSLDILTIVIFGICITLMIICTVYDLYLKRSNKKPAHILLLSFSVYTNGRKLLQTTKRAKEQILLFHGLKIISMLWVIAGHGGSIWQVLSLTNQDEYNRLDQSMETFYLRGGLLGVDTFFYISGFLLAWSYVKKRSMSLGGHITSIPKGYIHRYLRLSPAFFILFLVQISVYVHLGSGPYWRYFYTEIEDKCKRNWWALLLYVQNYHNKDEVCLLHTWYLSADMQLFIISPIVLIPLAIALRNPTRLKLSMFGMCALNIFLAALSVFIKLHFRDYENNYDTHSRLHVYFIGVMMGAFMQLTKDSPFISSTISKQKLQIINIILWIITLIAMFGVVITQRILDLHGGYEVTAYCDALKRIVWVAGLSYIVYSSYHGYGGFVNWLLCRPLLQIGGKLSYCIYLIHGVVVMYNVMVVRSRLSISQYNFFYNWCGHFILSTIIAVFWTLAFESPLITVERLIFGGADRKPKKPARDHQNKTEKNIILDSNQNGTVQREDVKNDNVAVIVKPETKME